MAEEQRQGVYDRELGVEACRFVGVMQPFPKHFHDYYVLGLVEAGRRRLCCRGQWQDIRPGTVLLFNPGDTHACEQVGGEGLAYRALHVSPEVMQRLYNELYEEQGGAQCSVPVFAPNIVADSDAACLLQEAHRQIMAKAGQLAREEGLLLLLELLLHKYGGMAAPRTFDCREEVAAACGYMQEHFAEPISLAQLCSQVGLSKSTLLRGFAAAMGVTPHSYLANIRISRAKVLLQQGLPLVEAALQTGFADQSHFTNCFGRFIGLTPGAYREIFAGNGREVAHE